MSGIYKKPYWIIEFEINRDEMNKNVNIFNSSSKQVVTYILTNTDRPLHMTRSVTNRLKQKKELNQIKIK